MIILEEYQNKMENIQNPPVFKLLKDIAENKHLDHLKTPSEVQVVNRFKISPKSSQIDYENDSGDRNLLRTKEGYITVKDPKKLNFGSAPMQKLFSNLGKVVMSFGQSKMEIPIEVFEPRTYLYQ